MPTGPFLSNGTQLQVEDTPASGTFSQIVDMVDFSGPENTAAEIDITNLDSTSGREYLAGLVDRGSFQVTLHYDPANTLMERMLADQEATPPTTRNYRLVLPDGAGNASAGENYFFAFAAFVANASISGGTDAVTTMAASFRITGAVTRDQLTP